MKKRFAFLKTKPAKIGILSIGLAAVLAAAFFLAPGADKGNNPYAATGAAGAVNAGVSAAASSSAANAEETTGLGQGDNTYAIGSAAAVSGDGSLREGVTLPASGTTASQTTVMVSVNGSTTAAGSSATAAASNTASNRYSYAAAAAADAKTTAAATTASTAQSTSAAAAASTATATTASSWIYSLYQTQPRVTTAHATTADRYDTGEVPAGEQLPDDITTTNQTTHTAKLSISCTTIMNNSSAFDPNKVSILPADGVIMASRTVTFKEGETVFDILQRECRAQGIQMEFENTPGYNSAYIEGIGNIYEFDCGALSGWKYKVNGWFPNYGCSRYSVMQGDVIEWVYSCNGGTDVGGSNA
ncbi:MAG: DUF4430 domain-containing protein [Oscillospiraceae bacterium]|nr:DUF4430 domain-containing protein [Oscillospiraceae bacterium]